VSLGDWIALTAALAGVLAALSAVAAVWYQVRLSRGTSSIDNTFRMEEQWRSADMLKIRAGAAEAIINEAGQTDDVLAVMTFFEQLGFLVEQKAIQPEASWESFSDWSLPYGVACAPFIAHQQKENKTYWVNFVALQKQLLDIEAKRRGLSTQDVTPTAAAVQAFLADERTLVSGAGTRMRRTWRHKIGTAKP
jgi:hypothetical protein